MAVNNFQVDVTIVSTAGTAEFRYDGLITDIVVTPVGTVSAANAKVVRSFHSNDLETIASEAVSTTGAHSLYSNLVDGGVLSITTSQYLKVVFDTATNDDVFRVTIHIVD